MTPLVSVVSGPRARLFACFLRLGTQQASSLQLHTGASLAAKNYYEVLVLGGGSGGIDLADFSFLFRHWCAFSRHWLKLKVKSVIVEYFEASYFMDFKMNCLC